MLVQKRKEQLKEYEKQEKKLKELKASGKSSKQAEAKQQTYLNRKQDKGKKNLQQEDDDDNPKELLKKPKDYIVKFKFNEPQNLNPPILGLKNAWFKYDDQPYLFKDLDFGIDMETKVAILGPNGWLMSLSSRVS
jgi:ATP-binding cassette subfamily F protein 1